MLSVDVVPSLCKAFMACGRQITFVRDTVRTISNLVNGNPAPPLDQIEPLIPLLLDSLPLDDEELTTVAFWGLTSIADAASAEYPFVFSPGLFDALARFLSQRSPHSIGTLTPAIRLAGSIVSGTDAVVDKFIHSGCLPLYVQYLEHPKQNIQEETAWGLSNITAGNAAQIDAVVQTGCMPTVIAMVTGPWSEVAREALYVLSNAMSGGTIETTKRLLELGVAGAFVVGSGFPDVKAVVAALQGLQTIIAKDESTVLGPYKEYLAAVLPHRLGHPLLAPRATFVIEKLGLCVE